MDFGDIEEEEEDVTHETEGSDDEEDDVDKEKDERAKNGEEGGMERHNAPYNLRPHKFVEEYRFTDDLYIIKSTLELIEHLINTDLDNRKKANIDKLISFCIRAAVYSSVNVTRYFRVL